MNWQPVSVSKHRDLKWGRYRDYRFACSDTFAPLVFKEFEFACHHLPILFLLREGVFEPIAVLGLTKDRNAFVTQKGVWQAGYVPAFYRSYPFAMMRRADGEAVLCADHDSEYVGKDLALAFVTKRGKLTKALQGCFDFLGYLQEAKRGSENACRVLSEMGVLVSCRQRFANTPLEHLYQIDEARFQALDAQAMQALRQLGILKAVYAHWVSLENVHRLIALHAPAPPTTTEIDFSFLKDAASNKPLN